MATTTKEFYCNLSEEELQQRSDELAAVDRQIDEKEIEKKNVGGTFRVALKGLRETRKRLYETVESRKEKREVAVKFKDSFATNERITLNAKTGEELERRTLEAYERQTSILETEGETTDEVGPGVRKRKGRKSKKADSDLIDETVTQ